MSFFGGDPFGFNDPLFGNMQRQMQRQMQEMDRMMMDPFGLGGMGGFGGFGGMGALGGMGGGSGGRNAPRQQMIEDGSNRQVARQNEGFGGMMSPFGFGGGLLGGGLFGGLMQQMDNMQQQALQDPNGHVYSQSTVITFDGTGNQPRYYESTNSVRKAGDVKEVRKTERNSATGEERMTIGHTIGDKTHVIEKKRGRDGRIKEEQRFVNLDQAEAEQFDREFGDRAKRNTGPNRDRHRPTNRPSAIQNAPIITLPDEDEPSTTSTAAESSSRNGPIITEISDDEAEHVMPKRRKGLLGKIFYA
uniref:Myeloid leukemia factor n=1 Tax=Plectus sambesii TaxID=2011161 RepID=A0A914XL15_9BILA